MCEKQIADYISKGTFSEYFLDISKSVPCISEEEFLKKFEEDLYPFFSKSKVKLRSQFRPAWLSGLLCLFFSNDASVLYIAITVFEAQKYAEQNNISTFQFIEPELETYLKQLVLVRLENISNQSKLKPFLKEWSFS